MVFIAQGWFFVDNQMMEMVSQQPVVAAVVDQVQSKQPAKGAKRHNAKGPNETTVTTSSVLRLPAVSFKSVNGFLHRCRPARLRLPPCADVSERSRWASGFSDCAA